jgi:hypothetical protein
MIYGFLKQMTVDSNGFQNITIATKSDFREEFDRLYGSELEVEIKKRSKRRSLDANAMAWMLIDKIAERTGTKKNEVYKNAIKDIGGVSTTICVIEKAAETLCKNWEKKGMGWQAEMFDSKLEGCKNVILWYGSSTYDAKQMRDLINNLIQDAEALGIPTISDDDKKKILINWQQKTAA